MKNSGEVLDRVSDVVRSTFRVPHSYVVTRETSSADVDGWDSLSHALFIMAVENAFGIELPFEKAYDLADIGELVDLICALNDEK